MANFDDLKNAEFDGVPFPVGEVRIRGGLRDHVHEFPHTPGGKPERMGRKLYEIEMSVPFLANLLDPKWANLWPGSLAVLRGKFERQIVSKLHIPTVGTIDAYCFDWDQTMRATIRSGEMASLRFREDQTDEFLVKDLIKTSPRALSGQAAQIKIEAEKRGQDPGALDAIFDAVDGVLAVLDQAELGFALIESKILGAAALCEAYDKKIDLWSDPENFGIHEALRTLWASLISLLKNVDDRTALIRKYTLPIEMSISDVAIKLYGAAERGADILKINAIEDAFAIPAGSELDYYEDAA
jgi:hypothetical protein